MENKQQNIIIYGAARCHKSQYYQSYLSDKEIDFVFFDVEKDALAAIALRSLYESGKLHFPTLVIGDKKLRNPRDHEIDKAILKLKI